jgi:hypothetical protein
LLERQGRAGRRYAAALVELARVRNLLGAEAASGDAPSPSGEPERVADSHPRLGPYGV